MEMTKEFYKQWIQNRNPLILKDALYYVQGVDPNGPDAMFYKKSTEWLYAKAILRASKYHVGQLHNMLTMHDTKFFSWNFIEKIKVISPTEFTMHMYQFISLFPQELFEAYSEVTGQELFLTDYSPLKFFYATQAKLDVWDVKKACYFIAHADSDWRSIHLYSSYLPPMHTHKMIAHIIKMAKTSIQAKQLKCFDGNPNLVRPMDMIEWAIKKGIKPHTFLIESVEEYSSQKAVSDTSSLANLEGLNSKNINIHRKQVEVVAKTLKHLHPTITIEEMQKHPAVLEFAGGKHYVGKHTLRTWISKAFPEGTFAEGRPRKTTRPDHQNVIS